MVLNRTKSSSRCTACSGFSAYRWYLGPIHRIKCQNAVVSQGIWILSVLRVGKCIGIPCNKFDSSKPHTSIRWSESGLQYLVTIECFLLVDERTVAMKPVSLENFPLVNKETGPSALLTRSARRLVEDLHRSQ